MRTAVRVRITGKVQGVWFRAWTREQAQALGLDGWVRNLSDGSVEALFAGPPAAVERALAACHRGPPAARVAQVTPTPVAADDIAAGSGFAQRPDA
ncbi:MAG: acylphosphatase [Alphaproteobacteria bacterium]|nr:acylphosphatase [Alphaproteobacteria bacterium]